MADKLVEVLEQVGVRRVYGVVGDSLNPVVDAIRYAVIAHAIGLEGIRVEDPARVRPALEHALRAPGPVLVDVVTDPNALSIPPHVTPAQLKGFALATGRTVLAGGVGKMLDLARANLRDIPLP